MSGIRLLKFASTVTLMSLCTVALAQMTGKAALESKLHEKLDRILTEDEYVIDIKIIPGQPNVGDNDKYLPGLQILGAVSDDVGAGSLPIILEGKADILLILDKKVSKERARVAKDLVERILESEGLKQAVKVTAQQKDINKIPPPEAPPPPPQKDPSVLEQIIKEKDFVSRALMVIWGAFVSLMAVYFVLRRVLISGSSREDEADKGSREPSPAPSPQSAAPSSALKSEKTRDELYSKDEAILNAIAEIKNEAKEQPAKVARILTRWVSQSEELTRAASLFLRNCEIKTVEAVCQSLHPSDLEKIISYKIEDFEPFGVENQRTFERMRADLAVLASEHILKERPDPLKFLKMLSDDEIRNILEGEDTETIAMVATQVPAHRMQKLFENVSPEVMSSVITRISTIKLASAKDFERLKIQLSQKAELLAGNLFTEKDRVLSLSQIVSSIVSPVLQCEMIERLRSDNPVVYASIRSHILLATDIRFLPARVKSMLIQSIDADTFGTALSGFDISFELFLEGLPPAYQSVFSDAQNRKHDSAVVTQSWKRVSTSIAELTASGLISKNEIASTIRRADQAMESPEQNLSQDQEDLRGRSGAA